jgi:hypothetical protein
MNVAQSVRLAKAANPQNYCPDCLYRTATGNRTGNYTYCPRHIDKRFPECICTNNGDYCGQCNAAPEAKAAFARLLVKCPSLSPLEPGK